MTITVFNSDIRDWVKNYNGPRFHAGLMDPPYNLDSITKRFGKENSSPAKFGRDGAFKRASRGFMGMKWDSEVAFDPEVWHAIGDLLYPGGFLMAYGGTRTYHRMAVAIEDAGFIIHPAIGWVQTMGFPKATRIDTQIDRKLGLERSKGDVVKTGFASGTHKHAGTDEKWGFDDEYATSRAAHPLSRAWEGHRYGLQTLKPSFEFICVAQKPYGRRPLDDILMNGAGAINIDAARIGNEMRSYNGSGAQRNKLANHDIGDTGIGLMDGSGNEIEYAVSGRWPANVAMMHLPECVRTGEKDSNYQINRFTDGAKPFGNGAGHDFTENAQSTSVSVWKCAPGCPAARLREQGYERGSLGNADDVFYSPQYTEEEIEFSDKFIFNSKVTPQERDAGLTHLPLSNIGVPDGTKTDNTLKGPGNALHPDKNIITHNVHPTLKPIMLNKWLATLLLPPYEYAPRRILVPFAGVCSEAIGCELAGWEEVIAVELEEEYAKIGQERVNYWTSIRSSGADAKKLDKRQLSFDNITNI